MEAHATRPLRVRLAPSPTGHFPVGNARTALFNWLFARQRGGAFILRIEDTDPSRSRKEYEEEIFAGLSWLGLDWDEGPAWVDGRGTTVAKEKGTHGPYRQSERGKFYRKYLEQLLAEKKAYYCYCPKEELEAERQALLAQGLPPKYTGHCRNLAMAPAGRTPQVIRFKTPESPVEFKDIVRGKVSFDASLFGDLVIAKDLDTPLFTFAGVVDDELMEISHVIRGEDHLSNTPKQILLQRALGFRELEYAHLPLLLAADRSKISKRTGAASLLDYREKGYLPGALVNFLALLGWHPQGETEILNRGELVKEFDLARIQKGGAVFNEEKLQWLNHEYLQSLPAKELAVELVRRLAEDGITAAPEAAEKAAALERSRAKTAAELASLSKFFFALPDYRPSLLAWQKDSPARAKQILEKLRDLLSDLGPDKFSGELLARHVQELAAREGKGNVLWPLRVALSGQAASPDPLQIADVLGYAETKRRIIVAIEKLGTPAFV